MQRFLSFVFLGIAGVNLAIAAVNLNTASVADLDGLKGVGPAKAQAIVDYRTKNGPFKSVDDLKNVKGFGAKSIDKLKGDLTVSGSADSGKK